MTSETRMAYGSRVFRHGRSRPCAPNHRWSSGLKRVLRRLADELVADPLVDAVRRRVREVGVQEAVRASVRKQTCAQLSREGTAVSAAARVRRRVDGPDAHTGWRPAAETGHGDRLRVLPEREATAAAVEATVD